MVKNTLTSVNVDTASSGGGHELSLSGLKDPHKFKADVWAMKRGEVVQGSIEAPSPNLGMDRGFATNTSQAEVPTQSTLSSYFGSKGSKVPATDSETASLISESNQLLSEQNAILTKILAKGTVDEC